MFCVVYNWFINYINRKRLLTFWWSVFCFVCFDQGSINIHLYTAICIGSLYNGERFTILCSTSIRSITVSWYLVSYVERSAIVCWTQTTFYTAKGDSTNMSNVILFLNSTFFACLSLEYNDNIGTLWGNIKYIQTSLETEKKGSPEARLSSYF